jgi:hypothetical protein
MKRIHRLLTGLAASLLFCACGAGDEEVSSAADSLEERASEQAEAAQSTADVDVEGQTAAVLSSSCRNACTVFSSTNLTGTCCICGGAQGTYVRSAFSPNVYLCY